MVIEQLDIKQQLLAKVDQVRTPGTLITTNTSGIPIHAIAEGAATTSAGTSAARTLQPAALPAAAGADPGPDTDPAVPSTSWRIWLRASWQGRRALQGHAGLHRQPRGRVRHHGPVPPGGEMGLTVEKWTA